MNMIQKISAWAIASVLGISLILAKTFVYMGGKDLKTAYYCLYGCDSTFDYTFSQWEVIPVLLGLSLISLVIILLCHKKEKL